jgi:hypothetical protein
LIAGKQPWVEGFGTSLAVPPYWGAYCRLEHMPALINGDNPPIGEGFAQFLTAPAMPEQVEGASTRCGFACWESDLPKRVAMKSSKGSRVSAWECGHDGRSVNPRYE